MDDMNDETMFSSELVKENIDPMRTLKTDEGPMRIQKERLKISSPANSAKHENNTFHHSIKGNVYSKLSIDSSDDDDVSFTGSSVVLQNTSILSMHTDNVSLPESFNDTMDFS
eukprot:12472282-Ditylum_brightwellii.AAC.1